MALTNLDLDMVVRLEEYRCSCTRILRTMIGESGSLKVTMLSLPKDQSHTPESGFQPGFNDDIAYNGRTMERDVVKFSISM